MMLLLWAQAAQAQVTTYDVRLCARVDIRFSDDAVGDRWLDDRDHKAARGFHYAVYRSDGSLKSAGTLEVSGQHRGCTPEISYPSNDSYTFEVVSLATIGAIDIRSEDDPTNQDYASATLLASWTPAQSGTLVLTTALPGNTDYRWNYLAAVTFAVANIDHGITAPTTLNIYVSDGASVPHFSPSLSAIILQGSTQKQTTLHELGHALAYFRTGGTEFSYNPNDPLCGDSGTSHGLITREWQSAAANEGFADFTSMIVWNDIAESDCERSSVNALDWDNDGTDDLAIGVVFTCEGDPWDTTPVDFIHARDWLEEIKNEGAGGCTSTLVNHGTQYDWARYFWDMVTDEEVPVAAMFDIWADSDPATWDADDPNPNSDLVPDDPIERISLAAAANGYGAHHDRQDDNGQDH